MDKKDDLPAMPFYVGDWLKAPDIQCLSYDLKGLWFEMLCYMWESTERGFLIYSKEELSRLLRISEDLLEQKLKQLLSKGIYSVREIDGAMYSRRMVRDQKIREIRTKAGSLGGRRTFANKFAQAKSIAQCEDANENENEDVIIKDDRGVGKEGTPDSARRETLFNSLWEKYPKRDGRKAAFRHFVSSVKTKEDWDDINKALENYVQSDTVLKGYIKNGSTWFNNWKDFVNENV